MSKVIIIGGGAAGMAAALGVLQCGHEAVLYEKNEKLGKKLYITGKGRCNVTNACETEELFSHMVSNGKFLYSAIYGFTNFDMMELLEVGAGRPGFAGFRQVVGCHCGVKAEIRKGRRRNSLKRAGRGAAF